jgi:glycerate 2-kinase
LLQARHPIPDQRGIHGTERILELLKETDKDDLVICVLSGGGSALLTAPAPGIKLTELQNLTSALLARGATINEINSIRKHVDLVKGGGLVRNAPQATMITLMLSDVVGDPLDVIASGPTVPDTSTYSQAYAVLEQFDLLNTVPASITNHLKKGMRGELLETPKNDDPVFKNVHNVLIGSNQQAAKAAVDQAIVEGYHASLLTTFLQGEARHAGRVLAAIARQVNASGDPLSRPTCLVCGGETTVTLAGNGVGGRNQELALGAVMEMSGLPNVALVTLATDGGDGPTDAAGAVVTGDTVERASVIGMNPQQYLAHNDSYHFFDALGDLLRTGPTQTNVNDLAFIFAF